MEGFFVYFGGPDNGSRMRKCKEASSWLPSGVCQSLSPRYLILGEGGGALNPQMCACFTNSRTPSTAAAAATAFSQFIFGFSQPLRSLTSSLTHRPLFFFFLSSSFSFFSYFLFPRDLRTYSKCFCSLRAVCVLGLQRTVRHTVSNTVWSQQQEITLRTKP